MTGKPRKFVGFAAFDHRGALIWGSFRTTAEQSHHFYDHHNPTPEEDQGATIKRVEIKVFD